MNADFRLALRQLRKSPGFAVAAVLTLALAIGANAVVFSVLNALVLRPLKVPNPESLYMLERAFERGSTPSQAYPDYVDLRDRNHSFESLVSYDIVGPVGLDTGGGNPSVVWPYLISGNYFDSLGIQPYLGRFLHSSDEHGKNSVPYVVLSYAYWHSHFNHDPAVVGRAVQINKHPYTILGVAPADFRGTELFFAPDLWAPLVDLPQLGGWDPIENRGSHFTWVIGHLKPGVTPAAAAADLNTIAASLAKSYPREDDGLKFTLSRPGLVGDTLGRPARAFMAGLMLAGRTYPAGRMRQPRQPLCGTNGGSLPRNCGAGGFGIDPPAYSAAAFHGSGLGVCSRRSFRHGGRSGNTAGAEHLAAYSRNSHQCTGQPRCQDLRRCAVACPVQRLSVCFGSGSSSAARRSLADHPFGIDRCSAAWADLRCATCCSCCKSPSAPFWSPPRWLRCAAWRGRCTVTMVLSPRAQCCSIPIFKWPGMTAISARRCSGKCLMPRRPSPASPRLAMPTGWRSALAATTQRFTETPRRITARRILLRTRSSSMSHRTISAQPGRRFSPGGTLTLHDDTKVPTVAVVNREFARKVLGSVDRAIGSHFKVWNGTRVEVVGVVEDGKYETLTEDQQPAMFYSFLQQLNTNTWLIVRSERAPQEIAAALQQSMHSLDPGLPLEIKTWNTELDSALFAARVATVALGVMGLLGAMLAVTGIFGMASYVVTKRLREFGIRVALGANQGNVLSAALGRAFRLLAIGSVAGMILGVLAARVLSYIVYQATPKDPIVLGGVILTMLFVGLVAAWIPARHALAVDPMILLREE